MAISGVLHADFSEFSTAVQQAEAHLTEFGAGADRAGLRLNKMQDAFSGKRIFQEAEIAVEAVTRVGGASTLTAAQMTGVNKTVTEAIAKYHALGQEAPAGMVQLAAETKQADTATGGMTETVKKLALGFAAMFTARAAFNFAKGVLDDASALKDLSQQTHMTVEEIQLLAGAMSEFGVDQDTLAKGLFTLSRKIAGGDDSIAKALGRMGISLQDLAGLNGQELFLKIERGLATLQGGLRDDTASEIFGSRLGMAMAGASEGIEGAMDTARQLNTVMSTESVNALDQYGEAIDRAERSLSAMAANMMGPVAQGFNTITDAAGRGGGKFAIFWAMTKDMLSASTGLGTGTEHLAKLLDDLNQKTDAVAAATKKATVVQVAAPPPVKAHAAAVDDQTAAMTRQYPAIDRLRGKYDDLDAKLAAMTAQLNTASTSNDVFDSGLKFTAETIESDVVPAIEAVVDQVRLLSGEMVSLADAQARHAAGGSFAVTAITMSEMSDDFFKKRFGASKSGILALLKQGFSMENAFAIHRSGFNPNDWVGDRGPRVPGFAGGVSNFGGGLALVGERGPELVNLPSGSDVIPFGRGGGGSTYVFNIVDNTENIARKVAAQIYRSIMQSQKVGA